MKQRLAWWLGFDLLRIRKSNSFPALRLQLLRAIEPTLVLDVGANVGQFARGVLAYDRNRRVVSFEPVHASHDRLVRVAQQSRCPNWYVAPSMAIGRAEGSAMMNVANYSGCSSLRPMSGTQTAFAPDIVYTGAETVDVRRLDEAAREYVRNDDRIYLKIDTQGYEMDVLEGATGLMDRIVAITLECSFEEMYVGETLALELMDHVLSLGFRVFGFCNGGRDPRSKALLYGDIFFVRPDGQAA
ncbi:MAG: FkbM family methyltransferase [Inquilinus sp.]|nr:FkbM family methyltransferase [Inquilinus sp.]